MQSQRFACKASIANYDLHRGWWYHSCPVCTKSVSDKGTSFRCIEHNEVTPIPWLAMKNITSHVHTLTIHIVHLLLHCVLYLIISFLMFS